MAVKAKQMAGVVAIAWTLALSQGVLAQEATPLCAVTGLVVDLGSQRIGPALSIRILSADGRVIYGELPHLSPKATAALLERGLADFASSWEETRERCGDYPLRIKALGVDGNDIIISNASAAEVLLNDARAHFLKRLDVALVFSKPAAAEVEVITD